MAKWAGTQNEVSVKGECGDSVSVVFQCVERLSLEAQGLEPFSSIEFERKTAPHSYPRCALCDLTKQCMYALAIQSSTSPSHHVHAHNMPSFGLIQATLSTAASWLPTANCIGVVGALEVDIVADKGNPYSMSRDHAGDRFGKGIRMDDFCVLFSEAVRPQGP
jgi:hypothetical protein